VLNSPKPPGQDADVIILDLTTIRESTQGRDDARKGAPLRGVIMSQGKNT
jgi:hypothetical protein